jgi:hypothetical protein
MTDETIFAVALEKRDPAERSAYLDEGCGGDRGLRQRVEALLASHDKVGNFLERPAVEQLAPPVPGDVTGAEQHGNGEEDALGFLQPSTKPDSLGRLGHYEVLEVLGQGGSGIVLKAFDEQLHRVVAIKVMAPQLASTSPPRKRFLREARAAAAIRHDNVVAVHAVEDQPIPYLVMEYIAGETLQQKLDRMGPLEVPEVLRIGQQIASGLAAAHALGLIHRDIKPSNILLENGVEPRVKITDFGLARAADDSSLTQSGVIAGTPLYMAPEQAQGEAIDQRADLFSLGSVLYVMCSGRPPFRAPNTLAVLKRVAEDTPRPIREIIPEVPKWLCAIVAKLHAKKPEERFGSAKEVADLLARHLAKLQWDRGLPPLPDGPLTSPSPPVAAGGGAGGGPAPPAAPPHGLPPVVTGERAMRPPLPRKRRWATAAALLFLLLAGLSLSEATGVTNVRGTVIRLFAPEGTLVVEVDDPDVSVTIDGGEVVITGAGVKEIRLKPGQYKIQANKDGKLVSQELISVARNGRQVVRVSKEAGPVADAGRGERPGAAPPPNPPARRPLDLKYIPAAASAAVVAHPRRILQSPLAAAALTPALADEMVRALGVKPEQVEQVMVLFQVGSVGDAGPTPFPGAILRFAEPVDGKQVLTGLLKGLREENHAGKTYYRSSTGEALLGLPLAGAIPDERTVLVAPEPLLRKMLVAGSGAKSPLLDRLRQTDDTDEVTGIVIVEPYHNLLKALAEQFKALLPANLADAASLPDRLIAVTAAMNLRDKTLLRVSLEADNQESVELMDELAFKGLNWARKVYPDFRPTLLKGIPTEVVQPALAVADQLFAGIHVTKEGKHLIVRLDKPESLDTAPESDLIASSGFNDATGMNSNPLPGSPFPLDTPNREGGAGEPGWAGPWLAHPDAVFQSKVAFEGDGALYLKGRPNFGPNYGRQLAQAQTGRFQVEFRLQVPAGSSCGGDVWKDPHGGAFNSGPNWGAGRKFWVDGQDTGFKCLPGRWYKVTLRIDVPKQTWEFFVDDRRFESTQKFRAKAEYLDVINFLVEGGVYIDALRVTRLPDDATKDDLIASSGFNDAKGINSNPVPGSPFLLDTPNREGGVGEPGWAGPWPASADAVYQSKVVFEGDGALYLKGRPNFGPYHRRVLAQPQTGRFQVEYHVQVPAGTNYSLQFWKDYDSGPFGSGPISGVQDGKFVGNDVPDTGFKCEPGRWYKVTMRIDVPKQTWELFVDDERYVAAQPLKFRAKVEYLSCINFIVGQGGVYLDALRVTRPRDLPLEKDVIASAGFNDARGMNSNPVPGSPYPLDSEGKQGGVGEPGWAGPWSTPSSPQFSFQSKVVYEGDGALYLSQGGGHRQLAAAQAGRFQVEMFVQVPAGGGFLCYLKNGGKPWTADGPVWNAGDGKFGVLGDDEKWRATGFISEPGKWHKVTLRVDVPRNEWQFFVDDQRFETPRPLRFRRSQASLDTIWFQCETQAGIYIDALRVTRLPDAEKDHPEETRRPEATPPGGVAPAPTPAVRRPLDLKYIPANASAAVVVHPRRMVQSPLVAAVLPPSVRDEMVKDGVKPEQLEQMIVFAQVEAPGNPAAAPPPDPTPLPGAILRFAEPVDGKQILTHLLKGLREESRDGKTYYRSSSGEEILGLPLAGAVPDERTVLVAPEPILRKMLVADGGAKSPLLDRLRQMDTRDEVTGIVVVEPYRNLLKALADPLKTQLPPTLADAASLPDRVVAVTAAVNLADKTLLRVSLEADSEESVVVLDALAFTGLNWARKVYPDFRPTLLRGIPAEVLQPALAVADQLYGGVQMMKEGKRLVVRLEKPEGLGAAPEKDLIASSGFNDARGMNSNPVPGSPFPLDLPNREGGGGEPGWKGPWLAHPRATFQSKVVFEGDGALYLQGSPNVGPNYGRQLVQAQTGKFQVEYRLQVPAGSSFGGYVWQDREGGWSASGPNWGAGGGKFTVHGQDTGLKCVPGQWHKVTLRIDVAKQTWEFFVDDQRFESPKPLPFRTKVQYLDFINFLVEGGVYFDALRVTRLPSSER